MAQVSAYSQNKWVFSLIQFFPLSLFATYAYWYGIPTNDRWLEAFQLASLAGVVQLAIVLPQARPPNRLVLAGNLYLIFGGLASLSQQWWYLHIYDALRESAIFIFMLGVGLISTFASKPGYISAINANPEQTRQASYILLAATLLALPFSMVFEGNRTWSAVLPIIALAVLQRYLVFRLKDHSQSGY